MKLSLIYRICTRILQGSYIVFLIYLLSLVYPFFTGEFRVIPPSYKDLKYYISESILTIEAPVVISNEGFYDINDLRIITIIKNSTYIFAHTNKYYGNIKSFEKKKVDVSVEIDFLRLLEVESSSGYYHIYNTDLLDFIVDVRCKYGLDLVSVKITYRKEYLWTPLIKYMKIDYENSTATVSNHTVNIRVPITIETSKILRGEGKILVNIYNDSNILLGNGSCKIVLGTLYKGILDILIFDYTQLQKEDIITFKVTIEIMGLKIVHEYRYKIGDRFAVSQ